MLYTYTLYMHILYAHTDTVVQVHFDRYNKRYGSDGSHEALEWEEHREKIEAFKREHIHQSIVDTEINEMSYPSCSLISGYSHLLLPFASIFLRIISGCNLGGFSCFHIPI